MIKWRLLACMGTGNHPSPHEEVPQVSFPEKRRVCTARYSKYQNFIASFLNFKILESIQLG